MTIRKMALAELFRVGSSKRVLQSQWNSEGVPFYRGREITRLAADGFVDNELFISEDLYAELASKYGVPNASDIMITAIGTIGNSYIVCEGDRFYFKDASVLWLKKTAVVSSEFINYWLKSPLFFDQLDKGNGATVDTLTIQKLQSVVVDLPPPDEQHRIVGILDEAFENIASARANAEQNLKNARALFESHLQAVFTQMGEGWVEKSLETVASILNGYAFKSTDFSAKEGAKCIKITNVGVKDFVSNSDGYLPESFAEEYEKVSVKEGSIVIALTRTIIAGGLKVAIVPDEYDGALLNQRVASIITNDKDLIGAFLFAYLSTQTVVDYVKERVNTLMQPNLSIADLRSIPIPVPARGEQEKIIKKLGDLRAETQRLESIYKQKIAALDELKKALMHKAFAGEL